MNRKPEALAADAQRQLRALIEQDGIDAVADRVGASSATIARAAAGVGVYRITRAVIAAALGRP